MEDGDKLMLIIWNLTLDALGKGYYEINSKATANNLDE